MTTVTRKSTATTERGTVINMTVTATRGFEIVDEISFCDGWNVPIKRSNKVNETKVVLTINGKDFAGFLTNNYSPQNKIAFVSGKDIIPVSERVYGELITVINEAKKEAETDESWISKMNTEAENIKMNKEYDKHVAEMERVMGGSY